MMDHHWRVCIYCGTKEGALNDKGYCSNFGPTTKHVWQVASETSSELLKEIREEKAAFDTINKPRHYNLSSIEPIDVIEAWGLGFHLGNTVKYIARGPHKGDELEDLKKARWYLDRYIKKLEEKRQ